jgi:dGTPase
MDLNKLFSDKRTGVSPHSQAADPRTEYQRDFDRIIFSSSFRRLQNKTQVFPLPGSVFVHNRLTHSLEVASVGRSLGTLVGDFIIQRYGAELSENSRDFYRHNLYNVISSACLCHDIGNPAFGHSGEDAIATFFIRNENRLKPCFSEKEWADFINFEGNANAIRILTQQQRGKSDGGLRLTYSTLSAIAKYPCESAGKSKDILHRKKFGFFQTEKSTFQDIARNTLLLTEQEDPLVYFRHPFVWLVEAADDICYNIIDLEDAQRLGIIDHKTCEEMLCVLVREVGGEHEFESVQKTLHGIGDKNDRISYLRAKSISILTRRSVAIYTENFDRILEGSFEAPVFDLIKSECGQLAGITKFSHEYIYNHKSVVEIENAGYNVMYELLDHFIFPVLKAGENRSKSEDKALRLIPSQFLYEEEAPYIRALGVLDYVSGMTDNYATELYKRIKGIEIGMRI